MGLAGELLERLYNANDADYRDQIVALAPRCEKLLDVGCDDGAYTSLLAEKTGAAVSGIEASEHAELARARGYDVRDADLEARWPFDDGEFDLVHANQVIEHVKRLDHFVLEIRRVLRPGGTAIVCTENLASWHNIGALLLGQMPFSLTNISSKGAIGNRFARHTGSAGGTGETWQHIHVVTVPALTAIFEVHGFEVTDVFASGYYPAFGRVGHELAKRNPQHAHFIGVVAVKQGE